MLFSRAEDIMLKRLEQVKVEALAALEKGVSADDIEAIRVAYLGRKGICRGLTDEIKNLTPEERPQFGKDLNELKQAIASAIDEKKASATAKPKAEVGFDITLPGRKPEISRESH